MKISNFKSRDGGGGSERFKKYKYINNVISFIPKNWETFIW